METANTITYQADRKLLNEELEKILAVGDRRKLAQSAKKRLEDLDADFEEEREEISDKSQDVPLCSNKKPSTR